MNTRHSTSNRYLSAVLVLSLGTAGMAVAGIVDGHIFTLDEVRGSAMRELGASELDDMIEGILIDNDCGKHGITVTSAEVLAREGAILKGVGQRQVPASVLADMEFHIKDMIALESWLADK